MRLSRKITLLATVAASMWTASSGMAQGADRVLALSSTAAMTTQTPYAESSAQTNSLWCQVYGCLGRYNYQTREWEGVLAESWEVIDDNTWRFTLREDLERHDGGPAPKAVDVIHSWQRVLTDEDSVQKFLFTSVEEIVEVDERTVDVVTKGPFAPLLAYLFDSFSITSAELYKEHGKNVDRAAPYGWGPYKLEEFAIDQQIVVTKNKNYPGIAEENPDVVIFRQMREPEQRITALLNDEIQIARLIPPQLVGRLESAGVQIITTGSIEPMFLAFNPNFEPWGDARVRRAAAHAIDRDTIIERLLFGFADRLDGPIGKEQICYTGPVDNPIKYDPERARELLAEAGYGDGGPKIDFYTANGRYISDRQIAEVVTQMLEQVGFEVTLHAPEWANLWADIRGGKAPMFYMGRGSMLDPSEALAQYFKTGVSPRIGYSNEELDELFRLEHLTFDEEERCQLFRRIGQHLVDEVPAHFMWNHRLVNGLANGVTWPGDPYGEVWLTEVSMKGKKR